MTSKQTRAWSSKFGKEYTDRNMMTIEQMDDMYLKKYGITRSAMNGKFLGEFDRDIRILEVGCNVGNQLLCLQEMGFKNLYGIEILPYAVKLANERIIGIDIKQGSALDIPYEDNSFDLVFTSGVLIHINPKERAIALKEIHRCATKYIWGFEYFSNECVKVDYRKAKETTDLLWKDNFSRLYCKQFGDLSLLRENKFRCLDEPQYKDTMFLLRKRTR